MNVMNLFTEDEPVIVKGNSGVDKNKAVVQEGSFIVPKESAPVAVSLTKGEIVIPPSHVPEIDAKAKQAGYGGIQDLAPESRYVEARVADPKTGEITKKLIPREKDLTKSMQEMQGMTESWTRDKKTIKVEEQKNTPNAFRDYKAEAMAKANGYVDGGFATVNGVLVDENGKPVIKQPQPIVAPENPYTTTPYIDEQVHNAFGDAPTFDPNAKPVMQVVQQEPTREDEIKARMEEYTRMGYNPLAALIDQGTPVIDEKKQQRLKFAAGVNALGQGLSTLVGGYYGAKGGPILPQENTFTPAALAEYNKTIADDKEAKYRNAMSKAAIGGDLFKMAMNDVNQSEYQKKQQEFSALERSLDREAANKNASLRSGMGYNEKSLLIEQDKQAKIALREATTKGMKELEILRNAKAMDRKTYDLEMKKLFEEYRAGIKSITEETETYTDEGTAKKTKTETKIAPPVTKPTQSKPKSKGKYEIQTW